MSHRHLVWGVHFWESTRELGKGGKDHQCPGQPAAPHGHHLHSSYSGYQVGAVAIFQHMKCFKTIHFQFIYILGFLNKHLLTYNEQKKQSNKNYLKYLLFFTVFHISPLRGFLCHSLSEVVLCHLQD